MATAKKSQWQNFQQNIWLIFAALSLLAALIFWLMIDDKELLIHSKKTEEIPVVIQPEKVAATTNLGGLTEQVRPLQLTTRMVASGDHLAEFRGTKFINDNAKNYTIEVFRSSNEDIIKSFLLKQSNRKDLIYFRLSGEGQAEQYVLALGTFKSEHEAQQQLQNSPLQLPDSVQPKVVRLNKFEDLVNDLGAEELQGNQKIYAVKLRPAALPTIDESLLARPSTNPNTVATKTTTNTTITVKDAQGQVVDVKRSQSSVDAVKPRESTPSVPQQKAADNQINDPFN